MFFTWPKLLAATCAVVAFFLLRRMRPAASGAVLGLGYLCHPLAVLAAPVLGLWLIFGYAEPSWRTRILRFGRFLAALSVFVAGWLLVGRLGSGNASGQEAFLQYFLLADTRTATW